MKEEPPVVVLLDSKYGIYIPKLFAEHYTPGGKWQGIDQEQIDILAEGPDAEYYWEVWDEVLSNATIIIEGHRYTLIQDQDLFAVDPDRMSLEELRNFGFETVIH